MKVVYHFCYNNDAKKRAHAKTRTQLRKVARALGVTIETGMLRTNPGGLAVWGETTLHTDALYIQVDPSRDEVLVRTCQSRRDYTGGRNRYISRAQLINRPETFARLVTEVLTAERSADLDRRAMAGVYGIPMERA